MQAAYYWIVYADDEMGNSVARESALEKAASELSKEEYIKLMTLLETTGHLMQ